ncbi:MAG: hypothetical protein EAZ53_13945 [Bacteroidetes bacterium]|nr:MAG: hypothetical protein EAZ53_13945 [Bacteroidota bacterium]
MELKNGIKTTLASSQSAWRKWLEINHKAEQSVWLIIYKKESGVPSVYYPEAVDEALCFGWIDSKPNKRDDESFYQFFSKRNPKSNWSKVNKAKIEKLMTQNKIMPAGMKMIELAKKTGTWNALDEVEAYIIPTDLKQLLDQNTEAKMHFDKFPASTKKGILEWILNAKTIETRNKRIVEIVSLASQNIRANQYVRKK